MNAHETRYRVDGDSGCIDVNLPTVQHLFDLRDPAPFRERCLDDDAAEYIYATAADIPRSIAIKLVLIVKQPFGPSLTAAEIVTAVRAHVQHDVDRVTRQLKQQRQFGRVALVAGLTALVLLLTLAEVARMRVPGHAGEIMHTGLEILAWVVLWKPVDVLLYEWWPLVQQRRELSRLVAAQIEVRTPAPEP